MAYNFLVRGLTNQELRMRLDEPPHWSNLELRQLKPKHKPENMYRVRDFAEERSRTLYVRLPHRIRDPKEVQGLFNGDAKVKLPRQASRACHVIFPSVEEKLKGMKNLQDKTIEGKRIIAFNPKTKPMENRIKPKKIFVPKPEPAPKITQSLFVSNISARTTIEDLKEAFPGSKSVAMLELGPKGVRSAFIKMESIEIAGEYLRKERELPVIDGNILSARIDTRSRKSRPGSKSKNKKLKIYDEDGKATGNKFENLNEKKKKKKENKDSKTVEDVETSDENEDDSDSDSDVDTGEN